MANHSEKRGGVASLGSVLTAFLRSSRLEGGLAEERVFSAWRSAAGETLVGRARAVRFRDGELLVEVNSAAHLQELRNFTGEGLRKAANKRLGAERIRRVVFQPER